MLTESRRSGICIVHVHTYILAFVVVTSVGDRHGDLLKLEIVGIVVGTYNED